jgi:hypothetical protein
MIGHARPPFDAVTLSFASGGAEQDLGHLAVPQVQLGVAHEVGTGEPVALERDHHQVGDRRLDPFRVDVEPASAGTPVRESSGTTTPDWDSTR